jgi:low affinity Fe/Cu permease
MVFLIQNTQNRDNDILHLKIDELIRATKDTQNATLCLEKMGSKDLRELRDQYSSLGENDQVNLDTAGTNELLSVRPPRQAKTSKSDLGGLQM